MQIYALLPRLSSTLGHIFHYHVSVQKAVHSIGWSYSAYFPQKAQLSFPDGWTPSLANDLSLKPKSLVQTVKIFFQNLFAFRCVFSSIEKNRQAIVFLEHFEFVHLASLFFALFFLRPHFQFWILYRYELENRKVKAFVNRIFLWQMRRSLGQANVKCLTDSALLAKVLEHDLDCSFSVVPIPHTEKYKEKIRELTPPFRFWWPGGLIREDKGLLEIKKMVPLLYNRTDIFLVAAEKARSMLPSSDRIFFIPTSLSREEYIGWMQKADLVLLPYSLDYRYRTSGIFVEAISSGTIPIVTKGTWMAYELTQFGLDELIFKWDEENLIPSLIHLISDESLKKKLFQMRTHYQKTHSEAGFAASFLMLKGAEGSMNPIETK